MIRVTEHAYSCDYEIRNTIFYETNLCQIPKNYAALHSLLKKEQGEKNFAFQGWKNFM